MQQLKQRSEIYGLEFFDNTYFSFYRLIIAYQLTHRTDVNKNTASWRKKCFLSTICQIDCGAVFELRFATYVEGGEDKTMLT